jgi:photosystem II stability/assembly factor-like uncharacterized protein
MLRKAIVFPLMCAGLFAQDMPPQTTVPPSPAAPVPLTLQNDGKPITLPFQCTGDDIRWAGMACSEDEPCPIYLELSAVEGVGNHIFAAGNIHSDTVTLYSVVLSSEDSGQTWRQASDSYRGGGLDHIQFIDPLNGWISGQTLFPISQDPFFLLTTDGGATWRQRPIFDESHFGSIQQFWFDSKTDGVVILDQGPGADSARYSRYQSPDGGQTWLIREQSDQPLPLKRAAAPAANWRVRADAGTRSYRIERRQGDRWISVAAFSVRLPVCKP